VWPTVDVVSGNFALYDLVGHQIGPAAVWCLNAWGPIRNPHSRWRDMTIVSSTVGRHSVIDHPRGELPEITTDTASIIPITRKSHAWLYARAGTWATEMGAASPLGLAEELDLLLSLRQRGLGEQEARERTPRPQLVARLDTTLPELLTWWDQLAPLRARPALLDAALLCTRQPKP
jgi:hypothetical protein